MNWGDVSKIEMDHKTRGDNAVTKKESKVRGGVWDNTPTRGSHKAAIWPNQTTCVVFCLSPQTQYSHLTHFISSIISLCFFLSILVDNIHLFLL